MKGTLKYSEEKILEKLRTAIATNTPIDEEETSEYFLRKLRTQMDEDK